MSHDCLALLDTDRYHDGYSVAFANIQYLHEKYSLPVKRWLDLTPIGCYAYIGTHCSRTDELILGESYAVFIDERWPHYREVMSALEDYPCFADELVSEIEWKMLGRDLPAIIERATEDGNYLWLREWYVQRYYSLEQVEHPEFGMMYPVERAMVDAMSEETRRILLDCIEYNQRGYVRPAYSTYHWTNFITHLRHDLFTFANNTRKERLHGWIKNWHTLPGIGG